MGGRRALLVSDPATVHHAVHDAGSPLIPFPLFDADRWATEGLRPARSAMAGARRGRELLEGGLPRLPELAWGFARRRMGAWRSGEELDARVEALAFAVETFAKYLFDAEVGNASAGLFAALATLARDALTHDDGPRFDDPGAWSVASVWGGGSGREPKSLGVARGLIEGEIVARRSVACAARGDALSAMIADGGVGSDALIRDLSLRWFLSALEPTADLFCWTWLLLARDTEIEIPVHDEAMGLDGERAPSLEDVVGLTMLENAVTEALRLYPPRWLIGRIPPPEGGEVRLRRSDGSELAVPARTLVLVSPWALHRDPGHYQDPEGFIPERWFEGPPTDLLHAAAFLPPDVGDPFAAGDLAVRIAAMTGLAEAGRRYRFSVCSGWKRPRPFAGRTLRPEEGLRVPLEPLE